MPARLTHALPAPSLRGMFRLFEHLLRPTAPHPDVAPPDGLAAFYWHFARQGRLLLPGLFAAGLLVALLDSTIPVFIGRVVSLLSRVPPQELIARNWHLLALMAAVLLVARPLALALQYLVTNQALNPGLSNLIRWQNHWHVVRQSWTFFQQRLRRPHRQPRDADGPRAAGEHHLGHQRRLVHPGLRRQRRGAARLLGLAPGAAGAGLVRVLRRCCCAASCRACASARARCRRCAPR